MIDQNTIISPNSLGVAQAYKLKPKPDLYKADRSIFIHAILPDRICFSDIILGEAKLRWVKLDYFNDYLITFY